MSSSKPDMLLWLDDHRGQYIPRDFANSFINRSEHVHGVTGEQWQILTHGPDHEHYWEVWNEVCDNATVTDEHGVVYRLHQDGALWLVPDGMEWHEDSETYQWPKEND